MEWRVDYATAYSVLKVKLNPNVKIVTEPGAMVTTIGDIKVQTKMEGGVFKALKRKFLGSESAFMNTYIAGPNGGEVWLAPSVPGDIKYVELKNQSISVQDMAYLAHHGDVTVDVAFRGFRGVLAEGEVFWLKISGTGGVWICGYGGIDEITLAPGQKVVIDNFHSIAIEETVKWSIKKFGGWKTFLLGGEGLVIEAQGPGKIYVQSRVLPELARLLTKFLPKK